MLFNQFDNLKFIENIPEFIRFILVGIGSSVSEKARIRILNPAKIINTELFFEKLLTRVIIKNFSSIFDYFNNLQI